jgi:hypothetical protein
MPVPSSKHLSAAERDALSAMLEDPERVEIHGGNREWRAALLACVMSAACLTFGTASAQPSNPPVRSVSAGAVAAAKALMPTTPEAAAEIARRVGGQQIASTAVTVAPVVYPLAFPAGRTEEETRQLVMEFVFGQSVLEPALGGAVRLLNNLSGDVPRSVSPMAWTYVAKQKGFAGCVLVVSDQHAPAIASLARTTGLSVRAALDFALIHESAHCAQHSEVLAAAYDAMRFGQVPPQRVASGLLGARLEAVIASGDNAELMLSLVPGRADKLSSERYADGFAVLALMAQQRIGERELDGLIAWRLSDDAAHNTAGFLRHLRVEISKDPIGFMALRSDGAPGFNAKAVANFLRPRWAAFERAEIEAHRESSAGLHEAILEGMKLREASTTPITARAETATRGAPSSN